MENAKRILVCLGLALAATGCSSGSSSSGGDSGTAAAVVSNTTGNLPGTITTSTGTNTVAFTPVSIGEMNSYVALHPLNAPTNFQLTVALSQDSQGLYSGNISLSYDDTGVHYASNQSAGSGQNIYLPYSSSNNLSVDAYNYWFNLNGQTVFSGFFQDAYGSLVLVIYPASGSAPSGDGLPGATPTTVNGEIWYRNFAYSQVPQGPDRSCWFITLGPFQCGSSPVINKNGLQPTDSYRLLGTFTGLSVSAAFGTN